MQKRVISSTKNDSLNSWLDRIGAFGTSFANAYNGQQAANNTTESAKQTQQLMNQMFGGQGGINTQPTQAQSMAQAVQQQSQPQQNNYNNMLAWAQRGIGGR